MRCSKCGSENLEDSIFCKECGERLEAATGESGKDEEEHFAREEEVPAVHPESGLEPGEKPTLLARLLSQLWARKGPILIALFTTLMMAMVFAPWAFMKLEVLGFSLVTKQYSGWQIIIPRILFFLSIIPLMVSLFLVAGISTRRRVIETHICAFFGGVIFTVWIIIFAISQMMKVLIKNLKVIEISVCGGQIATIILFVGFMIGIIVTSYDRGRLLASVKEG